MNPKDNHVIAVVKISAMFLISNFRRFLNFLCFLLGNSPESEFYMPTILNILSVPSSEADEAGTDRVFRNVGI